MPRMKDIGTPSNAFIRLNPGLFGSSGCSDTVETEKPLETPKIGLSWHVSLNKTEARFYDYMKDYIFGKEAVTVIVQASRFFKLKGGGTYTPDFMAFKHDGTLPCYVFEVKGGYRGAGWEQGYDRYKRTALEYEGPCFHFVMAEWDRKKVAWKMTEWERTLL